MYRQQSKADQTRLRALLTAHLHARLASHALERAVAGRPDPHGSYAAAMDDLASKARKAERDLRASVLRAVGLDPRLPTPRPIAVGVAYSDGLYMVVVVPDPNAEPIPDPVDGGRYRDGVRERDVLDVVRADSDDWLPWYRSEPEPESAKKKGRKKKRRA